MLPRPTFADRRRCYSHGNGHAKFATLLLLLALMTSSSPVQAQDWQLKYSEDFSSPLSQAALDAPWERDNYEQPFDTIMDDPGEWYRNDYGPAFDDALNSFHTYRREFTIGQDGWLTASLSARDRGLDGINEAVDEVPSVSIETISVAGEDTNVLFLDVSQDHTGGAILRPTQALPGAYRIEYKLTTLDFGGKRGGSLDYDGRINGYQAEGCKTQHPWGEGSKSRGWTGDASVPYCEWQDVREGPFGYNGFHFLTIVDFADPAPRNNHFWHYRRKVLMDSFSQHSDRIQGSNGGEVCDASTGEYYGYDESNFNTVNMWVSAMPNYKPNPGGLTGNAQRFITDCNGGIASGGVQSAGELQPELMPDETYTFAIERNVTGYTLEATGNFARAGQQTLRFHRPFVVNDEPIWHYNVNPKEYDGKYNGDLVQEGFAFGDTTWPDQWPSDSEYPDYFVIGDLYTNVYEGTASLTDIKLYTLCTKESLLPSNVAMVNDQPRSNADGTLFVILLRSGNMQMWAGTPAEPSYMLWESGSTSIIDGDHFVVLQGDANMIIRSGTQSNPGTIVWVSGTKRNVDTNNHFFGMDCDRNTIQIVSGFPDNYGPSVYNVQSVAAPTMPPTPSPTVMPTNMPTDMPTTTMMPSNLPSMMPSDVPSIMPSMMPSPAVEPLPDTSSANGEEQMTSSSAMIGTTVSLLTAIIVLLAVIGF